MFSSQSQEDVVTYYKTLNNDRHTYDLVYNIDKQTTQLLVSKNYVIDTKSVGKVEGLKQLPRLAYGTQFNVDGEIVFVDSYNIEKNFVYLASENSGYLVKKYTLTDVLYHYQMVRDDVRTIDNELESVSEIEQKTERIIDDVVIPLQTAKDNHIVATYHNEELIIPKQNTTNVAFSEPKIEVMMEFTESRELTQQFETDKLYDYELFSKELLTLNIAEQFSDTKGYYKTYIDIFIDGKRLTSVRYDIGTEAKGLTNCIGKLDEQITEYEQAYLEYCGTIMQSVDDRLYDNMVSMYHEQGIDLRRLENIESSIETENTTIVVFDEEKSLDTIQEVEQYELLDENMNIITYSDNDVPYTTLPLELRLLAVQLKNEIEQQGKYNLHKYQDNMFYTDLIDYVDTNLMLNVDDNSPFVLSRSQDDVQLTLRNLSDSGTDDMLDGIQQYTLRKLNQTRNEKQVAYDLQYLLDKYRETNLYVQDEIMQKIIELQIDTNSIERVLKQDIKPAVENTVIFQSDFTYANGKKSKFENNILAIEIVQRLDEQNRPATAQEKVVLQQYAGWGGLSEAFDSTNDSWKEEYIRLKELLPKEQYQSAKSSMLTAYYTDTRLIEAMYKGLQSIPGFNPQTILDPATATGNFIGKLPNEWSNAQMHAVEIDILSVSIAKHLYASDTVDVVYSGFEQTHFTKNTFDLVIGNVPFNDITVIDKEKLLGTQTPLVHDYFFAKSIDLMADNGVMAFITSSGTLDKKDDSLRRYMAERGELLVAIRLPNNAFSQSAHTSVVSDVLVFRKTTQPTLNPEWLSVSPHPRFDEITINDYFIKHPEHILGDIAVKNFRGKTLDVKAAMSFEQLTDMLQFRLSEVLTQEQSIIREQENTTIVTFEHQENAEMSTSEKEVDSIVIKTSDNQLFNLPLNQLGINEYLLSRLDLEKAFSSKDFTQSVKELIRLQNQKIEHVEKDESLSNIALFYQAHRQTIEQQLSQLSKDDRLVLLGGATLSIVKPFDDGFMVQQRGINDNGESYDYRKMYYATARLLAFDYRKHIIFNHDLLDKIITHDASGKRQLSIHYRTEMIYGTRLEPIDVSKLYMEWAQLKEQGTPQIEFFNLLADVRSRRLHDLQMNDIPVEDYINSCVDGHRICMFRNNGESLQSIHSVILDDGQVYHFSKNDDGTVLLTNMENQEDVIPFDSEDRLYQSMIEERGRMITIGMAKKVYYTDQEHTQQHSNIPDEAILTQNNDRDMNV